MTKKILTQELLKEFTHYCPNTGVFTWKKKSGTKPVVGNIAGSVGKDGYVYIRLFGKLYRAHRLVFLYMTGEFPDNEVDHINHIRSDNRISNLRQATKTENSRNRRGNGTTGVSFVKTRGKWRAQIKVDGKCHYLGNYNCITAAIIAREKANIKYNFHANHGK